MATKQTTKNISYRKNSRDYSVSVTWTDEMNSDVHNFYVIAREDTSRGYLKRLKALWDEKYPQFKHFTSNHLRQKAIHVENKRFANQEPVEPVEPEEPTSGRIPEATPEVNDPQPSEPNSANEHNATLNITETTESKSALFEEMKQKFEEFHSRFVDTPVAERTYSTRINNPSEQVVTEMNNIIHEFIKTKDKLSFWNINVIHYCAAITIIDQSGKLKELNRSSKRRKKDGWLMQSQEQISAIRRKISFIEVTLKCLQTKTFTKKQKSISKKVSKMCGSLKENSLVSKLASLKHDLKVCQTKLQDRVKNSERSRINDLFRNNQKLVYREFKGGQVKVEEPPPIQDVHKFWADIWGKSTEINLENPWFKDLQDNYCTDILPKTYKIDDEVFLKVLRRMPNNKAPGRDCIIAYWIKNLTSLHVQLREKMSEVWDGKTELPSWLIQLKTTLLAKNSETKNAKNYRPIACLNITYKLYTGILNQFLEDHCVTNSIIAVEQAGGKKGSWGCADQLLINKMVMEEIKKNRRSAFVMWFDYKKAFDSVPHAWIVKALELAKVPRQLIDSILSLKQYWNTEVLLQTEKETLTTEPIQYLTGILQGDSLSLLLFELCTNPLSFLLNKNSEGYKIGMSSERTSSLTHLVFVDDLKTFSSNLKDTLQQLDIITTFSNDIGMSFGSDKCAYMHILNGKRKVRGETIRMNGLELNELEIGESYKYLGQDEDISYQGTLNKEKVTKEYYRRVRKVWQSELYSRNKVMAYNTFAVPVLVPTFGILDWTKKEVDDIDTKTRKMLTQGGNFHRNSSVDRLYSPRSEGGRGLSSVADIFISRVVAIAEHLKERCEHHAFLREVLRHEQPRLIRLGAELCAATNVNLDDDPNPKKTSSAVRDSLKEGHTKSWRDKPQHGYLFKKQQGQTGYDKEATNAWLQDRFMTSHIEGYICAIQEQEIRTRQLINKRENPESSPKCRFCKVMDESIFHILNSCSRLSVSMYLPVRHNEVAKILYNELLAEAGYPQEERKTPESTFKTDKIEIWWDRKISVQPPVECNRPDIVLWELENKICKIIDICVPMDVNVSREEKDKCDKYFILASRLQRLYQQYTYEIIPVVVGSTGYISSTLHGHLENCGLKKERIGPITRVLQRKALQGSMKIVKTAMKM